MAEEKQEAIVKTPVQLGIVPETMEDAWRMAQHFAKSRMVPKDFQGQPEDVLVAVMWGAELGMKPMAALQGIAVINGRPSVYGDLLLAIIINHPDYEDHKEWSDGEGDKLTYSCTFKRKGKEPCTRSFSVEDAKKAQLWGKAGPWTNYPKRMLQMRSRSWAARDRFADALKGMHIAEEVMDIVPPTEPGQPEIQMPRRVETAKVEPEILEPQQSRTRTVEEVDRKVEENLGGKPTIEQFATGQVAEAVKQAVQQPADMLDVMHEAQTGHAEPSVQQQSEEVQREADLSMGDAPDDDFDKVVPIKEPAPEPEKKLKKDMTSAEQHLGPVYGDDKSKWPVPKKVLSGDYVRVESAHCKKIHIVLAASKRTELQLYEKLWKEWGIESTKDIPRDKYPTVLEWISPKTKQKEGS